jgi:hypothetical protein
MDDKMDGDAVKHCPRRRCRNRNCRRRFTAVRANMAYCSLVCRKKAANRRRRSRRFTPATDADFQWPTLDELRGLLVSDLTPTHTQKA